MTAKQRKSNKWIHCFTTRRQQLIAKQRKPKITVTYCKHKATANREAVKARMTDTVCHEQEMIANRQAMKIRQSDPDYCGRNNSKGSQENKVKRSTIQAF